MNDAPGGRQLPGPHYVEADQDEEVAGGEQDIESDVYHERGLQPVKRHKKGSQGQREGPTPNGISEYFLNRPIEIETIYAGGRQDSQTAAQTRAPGDQRQADPPKNNYPQGRSPQGRFGPGEHLGEGMGHAARDGSEKSQGHGDQI